MDFQLQGTHRTRIEPLAASKRTLSIGIEIGSPLVTPRGFFTVSRDRDHAGLAERHELVGLGNAIAIAIEPQTQSGKDPIALINEPIGVLVELGERLVPILRLL